jgi:hypothetical protein
MGHGLGVEFTHKTVGDAFRALATEWGAFDSRTTAAKGRARTSD